MNLQKENILQIAVALLLISNLATLGYVFQLKNQMPQLSATNSQTTQTQTQTTSQTQPQEQQPSTTKQPVPDELLKDDPLYLFWHEIDQFERLQKEIERKMQSQLSPDFRENFKINLTPKYGSYFHISNEVNINWKKLYFEINVDRDKITWKANFPDQQKLQALAQQLNDLGLQTKLREDTNTLYFEGKNISAQNLDKILEIFNVQMKVNQTPSPLNQEIFF